MNRRDRMSLSTENLVVRYGNVTALAGITLRLEPGEMFFLLGPSGCGKSTLLRSVAGFVEEFDGEIAFAGDSLKGVPAHRRDFGMVFQNYALFPHLTVAGNVAFGLEARGAAAGDVRARVGEALGLVGLSGYEARRPGELSGGQQQRVALARALVIKPRLLLLDEPLSNLDAKLRWDMRGEIKRIHAATGITTLYVTHDQKEALSMADRMAILRDGKLEALGPPRELYLNPPTAFAAAFLGDVNELEGTLAARPSNGSPGRVRTALGEVRLSAQPSWPEGLKEGAAVRVFCRPESLWLGEAGAAPPAGHAALEQPARVASSAFLGTNTLYELALQGGAAWRCLRHEDGGAGLPDGANVTLAIRDEAWRMLA
ncbi:MAG: ABC transporter ATP-binding protein [Planctomycetota bacterium]|nr:ABC transporter ATP-binding protein [Planctomycetota bacterium]